MKLINKKKGIKSYSKAFVYLIILVLLTQLLTSVSFGVQVSNLQDFKKNELFKNRDRYIIEFKELSLLAFRENLKQRLRSELSNLGDLENTLKKQIDKHRSNLLSLHQKAKNDILGLLDLDFSSKKIFAHDFTLLTNSIVVENIPKNTVDKIKSLTYIKNIRPDKTISISSDEPLSWGVEKIQADKVWNLHDSVGRSITGEGVSIAILDTGVDYHHTLLGGGFGPEYKVVDGYDYVKFNRFSEVNTTYWSPKDPDDNPDDEHGHGTHCAGIALGVAPGASLYAYRVMNRDGFGLESWFLNGMTRALDPNGDEDTSDHVDIISISAGDENGNPNDELSNAVNQAVDLGVTVVAAAGNSGPNEGTINSPGCAEKALTAGATDIFDDIYYKSSRGPTSTGQIKPDLVAPGVNIESLWLNNQTFILTGTSMATPHVAGAAALLLQDNPDWSPLQIKNNLKENAVKIFKSPGIEYDENTQGAGRIDILASMTSPIAILDIPNIIKRGKVDIKGTALSGTDNSSDFINYTLYYKFQNDWIKIHENFSEVKNSVLYRWDITDFEAGYYEIKLVVHNIYRSNFDIKTVNIVSNDLIIVCNETVFEKEKFTVKIFDENLNPVDALILFVSGFHIPQIKFGQETEFTSPRIFNPLKNSLKGKIIVIKLIGFKIKSKEITINRK